MSEETVRRVIDAFNAHDADAWAAEMTQDGTFTSAYWGIDGRTYVGRDGFVEYFQQMGEQWETFALELERVEMSNGKAVAVAKLNAKEPGTQVSVSPEQGFLFEFRGDKVASVVTVPNLDDALSQL
jgi:ketosteroid isomerase-like protein